jgi:hypothetical protein
MRRWCLLFGLVAAACGCGVLDKLTTLTFQLPKQSFSLGTDHGQWQAPPEAFSQEVVCATPEDCCRPPVDPLPSCTQYPFACETGICALDFPLEVVTPVDLGRDAPELAQARGQVPADVTLDSVEYSVASGLNLALPEVTLYVAPRDVASGSHEKARVLGVIPATNAGLQASGVLPLSPEARQAFGALARDPRTPFNFIASTRIKLHAGAPAPMGRVAFTVTGKITAKF